jgi:hypothetical protein
MPVSKRAAVTPSKSQVRQWLADRRANRSQHLPTPEELRQQLGWRLRCAAPDVVTDKRTCRTALHPTDQEAS